ncbi:MAG: YebC/PmpR family DNA-binding transcriptional regulator [Alphaproteobacteria bacterium]|nr:YebC/PmpR family DNA-binding transcriptional regulator [Alphaproteobacteria bacterium]MBQ8558122.1 YebC/PmpR family DNA-binding transcriptional regulator [Alphaproteobacteria bacterium]MBR3912673.1 YebC/PmpR family DNA-binding transcriptional regulator [Alphaproteobacteria bacterium]
MAGHSQFKNIMYRKGAQDKLRAKVFSKLAREITVAVKTGGADISSNPRLRLAIQNARSENMPKDNIERAIAKGSQSADTTNYEEVRYEGFGPGKVSVIVEGLTDNRARTAPALRAAFSKNGGALGETGSVTFNFERIGYIEYPASVGTADAIFEAGLEAGASDVISTDETHEITCAPEDLSSVRESLESVLGTPNVARLDWKPLVQKEITDLETAQKLFKFIDILNEDDDVQRVITNADIIPEIMAQLESAE